MFDILPRKDVVLRLSIPRGGLDFFKDRKGQCSKGNDPRPVAAGCASDCCKWRINPKTLPPTAITLDNGKCATGDVDQRRAQAAVGSVIEVLKGQMRIGSQLKHRAVNESDRYLAARTSFDNVALENRLSVG